MVGWRLALVVAALIVAGAALLAYVEHGEEVRVRVTTTTSLYATGLLERLAEEFYRMHPGVAFDFIPVGSGEALRRAEMGDACMVFVHAPSLEKRYVLKGVITGGRVFAYNYFIIAGPPSDPAAVREAVSPVEAFRRIFEAGERDEAKFVSRGDNSGTHVKELSIWRRAGLDPRGRPWYMETGSGMSHTLLVANEAKAYVLTDVGTYLKLKKEGKIPNLESLYEGGEELVNVYSVYVVASCSGSEREVAEGFAEFVAGEAQRLIAEYGVAEYGRSLFNPARGREEWLERVWERLAEEGFGG